MTARTRAEIAARNLQRCGSGGSADRRHWERELVELYRRDPSTHHTVIEAFRPLAQSVARRYARGEEPFDDLHQVAMVGLVKALDRFDLDRGSPFATYALPTMIGEVRRHFRDTGWAVHVTRGAQELSQRVTAYERSQPVSMTAQQVSRALGITVEDVVEGRIAAKAMRTDSLDRPRDDEPGNERRAHAPAVEDPGYVSAESRATVARLTEGLPERERLILAMRYSGDLSQAEIGRRVGLSQMHVSRILRRTLDELHAQA